MDVDGAFQWTSYIYVLYWSADNLTQLQALKALQTIAIQYSDAPKK